MEYITESTDEAANKTDSRRIKLIHERVREIRKSEKTGVKYMQLWEEMAYVREEGENKKLIQIVCRMLQKGNRPEKIADSLEESIDYIKKIDRAAQECAYDCDKIYAKLAGEQVYG